MKHICIYIFNLLFLLIFCSPAKGQNEVANGNEAIKDSINMALKKKPFGVQVGVDLLKLGSFALDHETKYEGQLGLSYRNVHLIFETGYAFYASELAYKNAEDYEVEGSYYRLGVDYAIALSPANELLLGARYATGTFEDRGTFEVESELWDNYTMSVARSGAEAEWGELILGTQTKVLKNLHFGWYFRWRKLLQKTTFEPIDIYNIPGYGKSASNSVPAVNFFIKYKLSF